MATELRTNNDARDALGDVLNAIHDAYENVENIQGMFTEGIRKAQYSSLDQVRSYTEQTYYGLPQNDQPISSKDKQRIALVSKRTKELERDINQSIGEFDFDFIDALVEGTKTAASGVASLPTDIIKAVIPWWVWVLLAGVAVIAILSFLGKIPGLKV